jgi:hypothetical protein
MPRSRYQCYSKWDKVGTYYRLPTPKLLANWSYVHTHTHTHTYLRSKSLPEAVDSHSIRSEPLNGPRPSHKTLNPKPGPWQRTNTCANCFLFQPVFVFFGTFVSSQNGHHP